MEQTFLTDIEIKKVRHLENISIPLDKNKRKHLILTGKNGSGIKCVGRDSTAF